MQIILIKYIQLICMTLSFSNQVNCDTYILNNEKEDRNIYGTTACSANCLDNNVNMTLEDCFKRCRKQPSNINNLKQIYENLDIKFICRDNSSFAFKIIQQDFHKISKIKSTTSSSELYSINMNQENNGYIYVIHLHQAHKPVEIQTILSNSSLVKIENLKSNTTYNISASIVHSNSEFSLISNNLQYTTLKTKYSPGIVKDIDLVQYQENENDKRSLKVIINWTPATDMTCYYDILFYPSHGKYDLATFEIRDVRDPKYLYTYTLEPFLFDTNYTIGIRSKNIKDLGCESDLKFFSIETPSCLEWNNNNLTICPPLEPQGLQATEKVISINEFSINITWEKPINEPDYYIVKILDLDLNSEFDPNSMTLNVTKERNNILIPSMKINGHEYEIYITAFSIGGNSTSKIGIPLKNLQISPDKHHLLKLIVAIILPLTFFAVISMLTFIMCHRRARTKRYKERCKYFEELEKKAPMDPKSNFEFSTKIISNDQLAQLQYDLEDKLFFNDQMELNRNDIKLYEVLGEGAFGLVRRGILKIDEKIEKEVAVKMLKDHPSIDDFKGFRSEIEVMKSVGKHPNIVSIIGHCTKNINDMMLLTEYCSLGNLLNYLRAEWNHINKIIYVQKKSMSIPNTPVELPNIIKQNINSDNNKFNFDSLFIQKISLKYKNINNDKFLIENDNKNNQIIDNDDDNNDGNNDNNDNNKKMKLIVNNQGYDYNNRTNCTNFCKCNVKIIDKKNQMCLKSIENITCNIKLPIYNEIHISNNCECKYIESNNLITKNINDNNNSNNNNNNDNIKKDFNENSQFDPLTVENQGYYKFLEKNKDILYKNDNNNDNDDNINNNENNILFAKQEPLKSKDLLYIAKQIAMGMEFLSKSKVVHRDLAARNVLVCHDRTVKIADFGLSRDVYQENVYKKMGNGKLPIKWLALESMTHQLYTTQSDVWSFGILLFEITTLGGTPYPAIPTNRLLALLKSGYRMEKPKNCGQSLYNLMSSCWKPIPSERPTFTEICQTLDELLENCPENEIENLYRHETNKKLMPKSVSDDSYLKPI